jgi:hypothetical protein
VFNVGGLLCFLLQNFIFRKVRTPENFRSCIRELAPVLDEHLKEALKIDNFGSAQIRLHLFLSIIYRMYP